MFSEENIKRTKEKLVEYVKDNAYSFTRRGVISDGNWSGYWAFTTEELSISPIEDAMKVLGSATTIDIIVETLNDIRGFYGRTGYSISIPEEPTEFTDDEDDDEDEVFGSAGKPFSLEEDYKVFISADNPLDKLVGERGRFNAEFENEDDEVSDKDDEVSDKDMVNHPSHYNQGKFETIDIIEDIVAGYDDPVVAYLVGTTLKYLARAPFKNAEKQDLEKAEFYLKRAIDRQQ